MTEGTLVQRLQAMIPDDRMYSVPYSPVMRTFFPTVQVPTEIVSLERQTVVRLESATELSRILHICNELREPLYVRQGTGIIYLDQRMPFPPGAVIADLRQFDGIELHLEDGFVECGAAVTLEQLNRTLGPLGFRFPVAVETITMGGLVSINLSGHMVAVKPADYVLGLEVVLPTGEIIDTGTHALRRVVGPDLTRLFVGSQSLLGVITRLRLRLVPKPAGRVWTLASFADLQPVIDWVQQVHRQRFDMPSVLELVDADFVASSPLAKLTPAGHLLMIEQEGTSNTEAATKMLRLSRLAAQMGAIVTDVKGEDDWQAVWHIRHNARKYLGGLDHLVGDVIDPPLSKLGEVFTWVLEQRRRACERWPGLKCYFVCHIGSGTIHPVYACPSGWTYNQRVDVTKVLRDELREFRLAVGGSVGEQGIFPTHEAWFRQRYGEKTYSLVREIRRVFDPNGVLNPIRGGGDTELHE